MITLTVSKCISEERDVKPPREVGKREAIEDGDDVCHTVSGVDDNAGGETYARARVGERGRGAFVWVPVWEKRVGDAPCA